MTVRQLSEAVEEFGLSPVEAAKVQELAKHDPQSPAGALFRSLLQFEKCVDAEVRHLLSNGFPAARIENESLLLSQIRIKLGFNHIAPERPLVSSRNLELGQQGSVLRKSNRIPLIQKATVVESNEFYFRLNYNPEIEDYYPILPGINLRFTFARPEDGTYRITTPVYSSDYGVLTLLHSIRVERKQQRFHVRANVTLGVTVKLTATSFPSQASLAPGETFEAAMIDISSGGMTFRTDRSLFPGDSVSLSFQLRGRRVSHATGRIVRVSVREQGKTADFKYHVQFVGLHDEARELISKFVVDILRAPDRD